MSRLIRILLLVFLVGSQLGLTTLLQATGCETCQERCAPEDTCGGDCVLCAACCTNVAANMVTPVALPRPLPHASETPVEGVLRLPQGTSEILHIPESTLV